MKPDHALNDLLRVAKMPRSSFYYKEIKRNYHEVKETILSLYKKNRKRDGYRPMTFKLRQMGFNLNHKTVLKLMNELGIHSILRKKRHGKRGKTSHIAPNLLNRDFTATALNQKWVTDVTEFHVGQETLYFSPLMDLANREVIAYNFATRPKFSLVKKMLEQGLYHSIAELQDDIEEYLVYYNQKRMKLGLKGLSPVQYRAQYLS